MLKKYLLKRWQKQIQAQGMTNAPEALSFMLTNFKNMLPVIAYVLMDRLGPTDFFLMLFTLQRIAKKLLPKGVMEGVTNAGKKEEIS
jgi:hypothetical protein